MTARGSWALITGGGRGIGADCARALAAAEARVIVVGRSAEALERVAAEIGGVAVAADLADRADTDRMISRVGVVTGGQPVSILVNNAGVADSGPLAKTDDAMWDRTFELNATATFRLSRALVPAMVKAGWGRVINVASNAGVSGYAYTSAYCASKHAVVGLTRALAVELATTGVTVNAVCPGWVDTDLAAQAVARIAKTTRRDAEEARRTLEDMSPQKRMMTSREVAAAVAFLCHDDARGINGQTVIIDGGAIAH